MARVKFVHYTPRPKPPKRPRRHKKDLTKMKKDRIRNTTDKEGIDEVYRR